MIMEIHLRFDLITINVTNLVVEVVKHCDAFWVFAISDELDTELIIVVPKALQGLDHTCD